MAIVYLLIETALKSDVQCCPATIQKQSIGLTMFRRKPYSDGGRFGKRWAHLMKYSTTLLTGISSCGRRLQDSSSHAYRAFLPVSGCTRVRRLRYIMNSVARRCSVSGYTSSH